MRLFAFLFLLISAVTASAQTPAAPTNVNAEAIGAGDIRISWTASAGVPIPRGYHIYRALSAGGTFSSPITAFDQVSGTTTNFTDTTATTGVAYKYMVRAYVGDTPETIILSSNSNEDTATAVETPNAPLNLRSTAITSTSITLAWGAVTGATSYTIVRNGEELEDVTTTTYKDEGLTLSTTYTYVVFATSSTGEVSDDSNEISVTTFGDGSDKAAAFARRFRQIDINADGQLSLNEYVQGHGGRLAWVVVKHRFDYSDTDGTGGLSLTEYAKALGGRKFLAPNKSRQFLLADLDEDGELQIDEYTLMLPSRTKSTKISKLFLKKDNNPESDGLSPQELKIRIINSPEVP